jgi:chemotaxis protein methyltransferase CheR
MPKLAERARAGGRVRLWSAACSNGQEPYSMALTVLQTLPEAADLDVRILATDIDPNMVAQGHEGVYSEEALEPAPATLWRKYFNRADRGQWSAGPQLRRLVAFRELNLIGDWPMKGKFDVIFCRNVVIYFDDATQERVWNRFTPLMNPGATLYIGHSERVSGAAAGRLQTSGLTTYQLGHAG